MVSTKPARLLPLILRHILSHSSVLCDSCRNVWLCKTDADSPLFFLRLLLKYVGRDEISLLGRGSGGVTEIRGIMEGYEENSPLYGFLQYRRRKVILRYMPEGMSRLLQGTGEPLIERMQDHMGILLSCFLLPYTSYVYANHLITDFCSSHYCPVPVISGQILASRYSLRSGSRVGIDGKCIVFSLLATCRLGIHAFFHKLPAPSQAHGDHRGCRRKWDKQRGSVDTV